MYTELWQRKEVTGESPAPGVHSAASASVADDLFTFGGHDGRRFYNSLHRLRDGSKWIQVCPQNEKAESPMAKYGARMVAFADNLAVLGGYGMPHGPTRPGSLFIRDTRHAENIGLTNEFHIYKINDGMYKNDCCVDALFHHCISSKCSTYVFVMICTQYLVYAIRTIYSYTAHLATACYHCSHYRCVVFT